MQRVTRSIVAIGVVLGMFPGAASAAAEERPSVEPRRDHIPGEVIVRYRDDVPERGIRTARGAVDLIARRKGPLGHSEVLKVRGPVRAAVAALEARPEVLYAEPNHIVTADLIPNDANYLSQWALGHGSGGISAPSAWDITTGGGGPAVAVLDSGADLSHPDLVNNLWVNQGEVPGNGIDDDLNGKVDDVRGWDWVDGDNNPQDLNGHGTHVSGIAGAAGNNGQGVAGVSWKGNVMVLRVLDSQGNGTMADVASAFAYAAGMGAKVVNTSLGGDRISRTFGEVVTANPNTLLVASAGNGGLDGIGDDNDIFASYPCNLTSINVVCVAASTKDNQLAYFSNYGANTVALAAPGQAIASTWPGGTYKNASGTSMAAPNVSGAVALLWAHRPAASVAQVKEALVSGVDKSSAFSGKVTSGGRLNVHQSLLHLATAVPDEGSSSGGQGGGEEDPDQDGSDPDSAGSEPDPEPQDPAPAPRLVVSIAKGTTRLLVEGAVTPIQEGRATIVLRKKKKGFFRRVAVKRPFLREMLWDNESVVSSFFKRRKGRCRVIVRIPTDASVVTGRRTFNC